MGTLDRRYQMFAPLPTLVPNKLPDQTLKIHFTPAGRLHESHPPWTMPFTVDGFTHFDHALFPIASRHRSQFKVDAREDGDDGRGSATNATEPGHREAAAAAAAAAHRAITSSLSLTKTTSRYNVLYLVPTLVPILIRLN